MIIEILEGRFLRVFGGSIYKVLPIHLIKLASTKKLIFLLWEEQCFLFESFKKFNSSSNFYNLYK